MLTHTDVLLVNQAASKIIKLKITSPAEQRIMNNTKYFGCLEEK